MNKELPEQARKVLTLARRLGILQPWRRSSHKRFGSKMVVFSKKRHKRTALARRRAANKVARRSRRVNRLRRAA